MTGECLDAQILTYATTDDYAACRQVCIDTEGCEWLNYYGETSLCTVLTGCLEISPDTCVDCYTGERECPELECG